MGLKLPHITILIAIAIMGIALLFQVIGVAGTGWIVRDGVHRGLWKVCAVEKAESACVETYPYGAPHFIEAVRAFGLMGVLVMGSSLFCGLFLCFADNLHRIISLAAPAASFTGGTFALIEWAVFVGRNDTSERAYLDYSFGLTITAFILCYIATVLFVVGRLATAKPA